MPRMDILSTIERKEFDALPVLTPVQQQHSFDPFLKAVRTLKRLKNPANQVHFLVGYGYFLATSRFFPYQQFRQTNKVLIPRCGRGSLTPILC